MRRSGAWTAIVLLGACGGGGGAPIPIEQLGPHVVQAVCEFGARCGSFPDLATCLSNAPDTTSQLVADVKAGKTAYDAAAAAACLDALGSFGCNRSDANDTPPACDDAFKGTVAEGGACVDSQQCVSRDCILPACSASMACCAGVCAPVNVVVGEGGPCGDGNTTCATGTVCDFAVGASTCKRPAAAGAPCTSSFECAAALACVTPVGATAGACGPYPRTGEDCATTDGECDARTDFCELATNKCAHRIALGGACDAAAFGCVLYANCDDATGTCVGRGAVGAACAQASDCLSGHCEAGACLVAAEPACQSAT